LQKLRRNVEKKTTRSARHGLPPKHASSRARENQPLPGACHPHVEESTFLLDVLRPPLGFLLGVAGPRLKRPGVGEVAFFTAHQKDDLELEALAPVQGRERDDVSALLLGPRPPW
jgi:hypothetical protein